MVGREQCSALWEPTPAPRLEEVTQNGGMALLGPTSQWGQRARKALAGWLIPLLINVSHLALFLLEEPNWHPTESSSVPQRAAVGQGVQQAFPKCLSQLRGL